MHTNYLIVVLILLASSLHAQNTITIKGQVTGVEGSALFGATITLQETISESINAYTTVSENGEFLITSTATSERLKMRISYLGYQTFEKIIENKNQEISITLAESTEQLKEVVVKSYRIDKKGDTLSYSVSAFKDQKDRTIADVMRKMPGITILPNGQITYLGEPIEKYYIEGLDLLEGKYNLANDNISAEDVSKVQILENHQPIKVLDSLVGSNRTSLNIKLKDNISITGTATLGSGIEPILFESDVTPLFFSKKKQGLLTYKYNNTGQDVIRSNTDFSTNDQSLEGFSTYTYDYLSIQNISRPPFSPDRWLNNNDHYGGANSLFRLKNDTDLKINISYINGVRKDIGRSTSIYRLPNSTLNYIENTENNLFINALDSKFTLENNTEKKYIKNQLYFKSSWDTARGRVFNDTLDVNQRLSTPHLLLENKLKVIVPIGEQLISFTSNTGFTESNQELLVVPGQFSDILTNNESYDRSKQRTQSSNFFTNNTAGFTKKVGLLTLSPEVGGAYKKQSFNSNFFINNNDIESQSLDGFTNNLNFENAVFYATNTLELAENYWKVSLKTPIRLRSFIITNFESNFKQSLDRFNFEPSLVVSKRLNPYWETAINGEIKNVYGNIENLYDQNILRNYRTINKYNTDLSEEVRYVLAGEIKYRNALKAIFSRLSFSRTLNKSNLIFKNTVSPNGAITFESILENNESTTENVSLSTSKYFDKIKTTITLNGRYTVSIRPQIFNDNTDVFTAKTQSYQLRAESEMASWLSVSIDNKLGVSKLEFDQTNFNSIYNLESFVNVFFYFNDKQYLSLEGENYYNSGIGSVNNTFLNMSYQYTFEKSKIDTKLIWSNVFNTQSYERFFNSDFFSNQTSYIIRPSQLILSARFSF